MTASRFYSLQEDDAFELHPFEGTPTLVRGNVFVGWSDAAKTTGHGPVLNFEHNTVVPFQYRWQALMEPPEEGDEPHPYGHTLASGQSHNIVYGRDASRVVGDNFYGNPAFRDLGTRDLRLTTATTVPRDNGRASFGAHEDLVPPSRVVTYEDVLAGT